MKRCTPLIIFFVMLAGTVSAQLDTALKLYTITSKIDDVCTAEVSLTLFDDRLKLDHINQLIINELLREYYNTGFPASVTLPNLYANQTFGITGEFGHNVFSSCTYNKDSLLSFIACPYNVCDKAIRSNLESVTSTIDLKNGQMLTLNDVIDPAKKDSFEKYVFITAKKYHVKNLPTCYVPNYRPLEVRASSNAMVIGDTITYLPGITNRFYFKGDNLMVYNNVSHNLYPYTSVEVTFQLFYVKYFMRKEMRARLGLN